MNSKLLIFCVAVALFGRVTSKGQRCMIMTILDCPNQRPCCQTTPMNLMNRCIAKQLESGQCDDDCKCGDGLECNPGNGRCMQNTENPSPPESVNETNPSPPGSVNGTNSETNTTTPIENVNGDNNAPAS